MSIQKNYYKVIESEDYWWICSEDDLKRNIIDWVNDAAYEDEKAVIGIEQVKMTEEEFEKLPEFDG